MEPQLLSRARPIAKIRPMLRAVSALVLSALFTACHGAPPAAAEEASVKPGINKDFLDPALDVTKYEQRFEVESREIYAQRARIAGLLQLQEGMSVADVGAGTGLYTMMFAPAVGPAGTVYGVDIAPKFVEHIGELAKQRKLLNVKPLLCSERSTELPADSVDLVFVCDTYHHFEYPHSTLASIHRALRPGGELVIVDFIREPGVSRQWVLDHVRAGLPVVEQEVESAGFRLVQKEDTPFLSENYMVRFQKQ